MNELCSRWKEVYSRTITEYEMALKINHGYQSTFFSCWIQPTIFRWNNTSQTLRQDHSMKIDIVVKQCSVKLLYTHLTSTNFNACGVSISVQSSNEYILWDQTTVSAVVWKPQCKFKEKNLHFKIYFTRQ